MTQSKIYLCLCVKYELELLYYLILQTLVFMFNFIFCYNLEIIYLFHVLAFCYTASYLLTSLCSINNSVFFFPAKLLFKRLHYWTFYQNSTFIVVLWESFKWMIELLSVFKVTISQFLWGINLMPFVLISYMIDKAWLSLSCGQMWSLRSLGSSEDRD